MSASRAIVLSSAWVRAPREERGFAVRSIAGALTCLCDVDVLVPGPYDTRPDGAFSVTAIGEPRPGHAWPASDDVMRSGVASRREEPPHPGSTVAVVEADDEEAHDLAAELLPDVPIVAIGSSASARAGLTLLAVDVPAGSSHREGSGASSPDARIVHPVGLYARVHPGALDRRHYGLRSVPGYLLVLGDRTGAPLGPWPSPRVRWLLARFPRLYVVVVEGAGARVWRSRSCVASFDVHTRMDLWLVSAHASGVIDLRPGPLFARECVEALRYGVPVVAPAGSSADGLAASGGALSFSDTAELLECVETLDDVARRAAIATGGREVVDRWYGSPSALVERLAGVLRTLGSGI